MLENLATPFEGIGDNLMEFVAYKILKWFKMLIKTLPSKDQYKY